MVRRRKKNSQVGWINFLKGVTREKKCQHPYWIRQKAPLIQFPAPIERSSRFLIKEYTKTVWKDSPPKYIACIKRTCNNNSVCILSCSPRADFLWWRLNQLCVHPSLGTLQSHYKHLFVVNKPAVPDLEVSSLMFTCILYQSCLQ